MNSTLAIRAIPVLLALAASALLAQWVLSTPAPFEIVPRLPGQDGRDQAALANRPPVNIEGKLVKGEGKPADWPGSWPRFRGADFTNVSREAVPLLRQLDRPLPKLWEIQTAEGYAGAIVHRGRVYFLDYDVPAQADVLRCISLADGREIWRRAYEVEIGRNHGITRTTAAATDTHVVSLGPKCHVLCVDADTGAFKWGIDLARDYKTTVPPWYAGQCPLIDGDRAILAPAGPEALMIAVDLETGTVVWKTPNPRAWQMTHSSIIPMEFAGRHMYLYCGSGGVVGVSADDGSILWDTTEWRVTMANVPSPIPIGDGRIFLSGGYGAGAMMLRLTVVDGRIVPQVEYRLPAKVFGAEQQTPVLYNGFIYGLVPWDGQLVCLSLDGQRMWASGRQHRFGLGPLMIADGMVIAVNDAGQMSLVEATDRDFVLLGQTTLFEDGHEAWGPLALAGGRLIARDMTRMACFDLRRGGQ